MAIKTRLLLAMAALLCAASIVIGSIAITAVTSSMTDNIDAQLYEYLEQADASAPTSEIKGSVTERPTYQQIAVLLLSVDGDIVKYVPAGFADNPAPAPDLHGEMPFPSAPFTVTSAYGTTPYRVAAREIPEGYEWVVSGDEAHYVIAAIPLSEVDRVRHNLTVTMSITGLCVITAGLLAALWITRRGLRPVDNMIDAASAVASGDLRRRLPAHSQRTEIGRLATALNVMVSKLVGAITERDLQQVRLRRFVADASHELRTPLAAISGYAELYESGAAPPGPALDRAIQRIRGESDRMARLVDDLLLLARLDQIDDPNSLVTFDLVNVTDLVRECIDDARAADPQHTWIFTPGAPVLIAADEARLRQVVTNLLTNARIHTPPSTTVTTTVTTRNQFAVITVNDDGPGIAPEHRHRVFDRFYRADDSRSRQTGGTGLGLAIVKSIIESHNGRVELASQLGKGTTIRVLLPLPNTDMPTAGS